jgi:hypothetical protein
MTCGRHTCSWIAGGLAGSACQQCSGPRQVPHMSSGVCMRLLLMLRLTVSGGFHNPADSVRWRVDYLRLSAPGIMVLTPFVPGPGSQAPPQSGLFAVMTRTGRSAPRVFALHNRDVLLGHMQQAARKRLAINITSKSTTSCWWLSWMSGRPSAQQRCCRPVLPPQGSTVSFPGGRGLMLHSSRDVSD